MDKNFILNIYIIFITVRFKIDHPASRELIKLLRCNLLREGKNDTFVNDILNSTILKENKDYDIHMSYEKSIAVNVEPYFTKLYMHILDRLVKLLDEHEFEQAFDIVDAFHWLPESIAYERKIYYVDFFSIYVVPLGKKWGDSLVNELSNLLPQQ